MDAYTSKRWSWLSAAPGGAGYEAEYEAEIAGRHFDCDPATFERLLRRLRAEFPGRVVTTTAEGLRSGLGAAVDLAVRRARAAAGALRARPRSAKVKSLFQDAFAVSPDFVPSWRTRDAGWADLGELVAIRLEDAANDLADGSIHFYCWNDARDICKGDLEKYRAETPGHPGGCVSGNTPGPSKMCLGLEFWVWLIRGDFEKMAAVLIHEALHDFFMCFIIHGSAAGGANVTSDTHGGPRRFRNANCYVVFMMGYAGKDLPECTRSRCLNQPEEGCSV